MKDSTLELIALAVIILGLILGIFLVFDYESIDGYFVLDDSNSYIEGNISNINYGASGWTYVEISSCKIFNAYFEGEIDRNVGEEIFVKGSMFDGSFTIEDYK